MSTDEAVEEKSRRRRRRGGDDNDSDESQDRSVTQRKDRSTRSRRSGEQVEGGNFITRSARGMREYLAGVRDELDKVVWPPREDTIRLSMIVIAVTTAASLALGAISFLFTELFIIGLRENNPIIFIIFGVAAVAVYFGYVRFFSGGDEIDPYA